MDSDASGHSSWHEPLDRASERDQKLTFGLYVTPDPEQNPIDPPERFTGYHTALDYEIFPDEIDQPVKVYGACDGKVVYKKWVEGYGGTFIQTCLWEGETVTVLYGHLDIGSITLEVGDQVKPGDEIGELGDGQSEETSFNRKHLHLGIHKGGEVELLGYVQDQADLANYIDPATIFDAE